MAASALNMGRREKLAFRAVNRRGQPGYMAAMHLHHLLPLQLRTRKCFARMLADMHWDAVGYDDFRFNGLLLPTSDKLAIDLGLPLHRGPHRIYNEVVSQRIGQIEAGWAGRRCHRPEEARAEA